MITYKKIKDYQGGIKDVFCSNTSSFYEFSEPITKGKFCGNIYNLDKPTKFVQVSDAKSHIERLVFPLYVLDGYTDDDLRNEVNACCDRGRQCEGVWTMLIHGGDIDTIEPVNNYLERLVSYNEKEDKQNG